MALDIKQVRVLLQQFDLQKLFIEELGWDHHQVTFDVALDGHTYHLAAVAHKRGVIAFVCKSPTGGDVPDYATRRKIERVVARTHAEHLIVFVSGNKTTQIWQWVKREPGRPAASREHTWHTSQPGEALIQKLGHLVFTIAEEESITILDSTGRVRAGFDLERVTKRFYDRFKTEHDAFAKFIKGIPDEEMHGWYVSVMLNRLMFIYFIQKKGFLNGDPAYLRTKLGASKQAGGNRFYKHFLCPLFFEGFAVKEGERSATTNKLLGKVPYLNGGLFLRHQIEEHWGDNIQISDAAFEKVFDFFDGFHWHLDERPLRQDNEINPDVLGYIFEKYINQKQMGAYYTKEDITEYNSKNTIIPYLFDAAQKQCLIPFEPDGFVWNILKEDPGRYIYSSLRHGVLDNTGRMIALPPEIEAGVAEICKRVGWNKPAPQPFGLPTETWREYIDRRQRCLGLCNKLQRGELTAINDLITLNLDIRQFAQDVIDSCDDPELLWVFYQLIEKLTVLDPTCGSGAFLFAALNILEPLYESCLQRMDAFVRCTDGERRKVKSVRHADFEQTLARIELHPNHRYFVLKSIIVNNLYGVDIMEEAVEICKLRLFLKLVAQVEKVEQIEPLPDIDFNIRAGNTLIGFATFDQVKKATEFGSLDFEGNAARIAQKAAAVDILYNRFRHQQLEDGPERTSADAARFKCDLLRPLQLLRLELDKYLANEYGNFGEAKLAEWRQRHQPFHWFIEFYGIMNVGGFDVIVGNPPYVATSKVKYLSAQAKALKLPDLYAHILLRSITLGGPAGRFAMIVPLSITFSEDFGSLRKSVTGAGSGWFSSYDNIPAALFAGVSQRCTIWIGDRSVQSLYATQIYRWRSLGRPNLVANIAYTSLDGFHGVETGIPRVARRSLFALSTMGSQASYSQRRVIGEARSAKHWLGFSPSARNFVSAFREPPPCLNDTTLRPAESSDQAALAIAAANDVPAAVITCVGEVFFHHWLTWGDGFHVTNGNIASMVRSLEYIPNTHMEILRLLGECLLSRRNEALVFKRNAGKYVGNFNYRGHAWLTRRADLTLLAGLNIGRETAIEVFSHVQRVLAINEFAGEKSIPDAIKEKFRPKVPDEASEKEFLVQADEIIQSHFKFSRSEMAYLFQKDVTYNAVETVE